MNTGVLITSTRQTRQAMRPRAAFTGTVSSRQPEHGLAVRHLERSLTSRTDVGDALGRVGHGPQVEQRRTPAAMTPVSRIDQRHPSSPPKNPANIGSENAAAAAPKLPQPPYTPSAVPTSLGGNHSDTMRMPTTNPAPTTDRASRLSDERA